MTHRELYTNAIEFLLSFEIISQNDIEKHLVSEYKKPNDLRIIYRRLCESAQNKQMSARVIGGSIGGIKNLKNILFDFDPRKVTEKYNKSDSLKLLNDIVRELNPSGQIRKTNRSLWPLFCQSVIDSAYFLNSFESSESFYSWTDFFANDSIAKPALPLMISIEISGFGFPLACDFLKELGFVEYGKPDVHIKDIFKALGIIDSNGKTGINQDYSTLKAIDEIAKENQTTPYAIDKIFWLIGSGDFYLTNKKIGRQKKEFIKRIIDQK